MIQNKTGVLTLENIDYILGLSNVIKAKQEIDNKTTGSVYFTVELTSSIKECIKNILDLDLTNVKNVPMRWIKGDTEPHVDKGSSSFDKTYLIYLTDSNGELIFGENSYPIVKNNAYIFDEGIHHETVNTGTEPRLLLGPMSESGFAVGGSPISTTITTTGTVYIRQGRNADNSFNLDTVEYSTDDESWVPITWPCTITNSSVASGSFLKVIFTDDITLNSGNKYFVCGSDYIQFGSDILNNDGTRPKITIDGVTGYIGLIQNNEFSNIHIYNLEVLSINGSILEEDSGWVCSITSSTNLSNNYIINCHTDGDIGDNCGGIVSIKNTNEYQFNINTNLTIIGCSSVGEIGSSSGGIVYSNGLVSNITIKSCWTSGNIDEYGGGIANIMNYSTIENCYTTGNITGFRAGGIIRYLNNSTITNCYTTGIISGESPGGIAGGIAGETTVGTITNCYSTGNISGTNSGGIVGYFSGSLVSNCYTTGTISNGTDGIVGINDTGAVTYSGHTTGWNTTNAKDYLTDFPLDSSVGSVWVNIKIDTPYELYNIGYSQYLLTNINGTPNLIKYYEITLNAGESTGSGKLGSVYKLYDNNENITIDPNTGAILTSSSTPANEYVFYVRSNDDNGYYYSKITLTVTGSGQNEPETADLLATVLNSNIDINSAYVCLEKILRDTTGLPPDKRLDIIQALLRAINLKKLKRLI